MVNPKSPFVSLLLLLFATTHGSATTLERRPRGPRLQPTRDDIPSGIYCSRFPVHSGLGSITSLRLAVEHTGDACTMNVTFFGQFSPMFFESPLHQLQPSSLCPGLRFRHPKCYYFSRFCTRQISNLISSETGRPRERGINRVLLCSRNASTTREPELVLYLDVVRGRGRYVEFNLPVDLVGQGALHTNGSGEGSDGQPVRKRPRLTHVSAKAIKDGGYSGILTHMEVETSEDGRRHVSLTSTTDDLELIIIGDALLIPADDYPTTGFFKLGGGPPNSELRVRPEGEDTVILSGLGHDRTLVLEAMAQLR